MAATTAFSIWGQALAESKLASTPALNPAATSFYLPSCKAMDPKSAPFCPDKMITSGKTVIKSSTLPDSQRDESTLQRSAWKQAKGAPCKVAKTPSGRVVPRSKSSRASAVRPPTPPRTRPSSTIRHKKADDAPSHIKKHLDQLQSLPLVRSGLSDLLDGLAVLPVAESLPAAVSAA
eukprot:CAMPEP_0119093536 /NCGR_PEP_ID=MMETSP1178-20130426/163442_1 /TAXON_ID=33656 /ORGANISM="unid sp, Strain CCMP2000" /LENGTH=176 /DNA_ID=CAMNT_0007077195 /DNA_START=63 /DNA_END=593 /DNA_ORIENTATION=-